MKKGAPTVVYLRVFFPVDAFMIYTVAASGAIPPESLTFTETPGRCVFLNNGLCAVYSARPVICRTHGYPVIVEGKADFCPENFKGLKSIDSENILDLENLNKALASINIIFQREIDNIFFVKERITLKELKVYILQLFNFQKRDVSNTDRIC